MPLSTDILSCSLSELSDRLVALGEPAYRAKQVFEWIYRKGALDHETMTSLPKGLRDKLAAQAPFPILKEKKVQKSGDGTAKFLWELRDGQAIETVFIPMEDHNTLCISSQAGCKFGCGFCASGLGGWKRNLDCGEIIGQILQVRRAVHPKPVTHIVFMGVGEPFDNYDNVLKAVRLMNAKEGLEIGARRITISTCGVVPGIKKLVGEGLQIELSVSLHASSDRLRDELMPVNRKYPLKELMSACRGYAEETGRQVTFEYILIKGKTCNEKNADELKGLLRGWLCKINLIACNPVKEFACEPPVRSEIENFLRMLEVRGIHATFRTPRGRDIAAACGQLRHA
ncbi:MAG: 23S rRNA (adenine(2503)-C(2))-methyltransferase RlmN [Candidatus Omnitrophica bacterium]|nr:23S rRNA (adenine(2503)-C(2))-methyltransferase RlmN [Candidatus Omnitrophota bacterium]